MTLSAPQPTLAARRAAFTHDQLLFCMQLPLTALIERQPSPGTSDLIELACYQREETRGIMVFLSPLDAMIECCQANAHGGRYELMPFELTDPRPFVRKQGGIKRLLRMFLVYGYAANNNALLSKKNGDLMPLLKYLEFKIPRKSLQRFEHFHLDFSPSFHGWINRQLQHAKLFDYGRANKELTESSMTEIALLADGAMKAPKSEIGETSELTQCAFFDVLERRWRFVDYEDPEATGIAR